MYFHDSQKRATKELAPGVLARTFWGEGLMLVLVDLAPHAVVPAHSHPHEQAGVVLQGKLAFEIGGEQQVLGPGDVYTIPGGTPHAVRTLDHPAQVLDVFTPVRADLQYA